MIRIDALEQIGGYDTQFSLEYSDTAMFRKLHQYGKRVGISGDIQLRHEFSLIEMNRLLSAERYRRTLAAESAFWDLHMNWLAGCERTMRLLLRSVRQRLRKDRADLRRVTLEFLALRLFHSRRFRLARWRAAVAGEASHIATMEQRPRVSVCMAAYNGGRFIQEQLDSIFPQLAADDEVVIVDDCSTDDTIARIQNCRDERIRLLVHEKNQGVVATFEDT
jgi:GT2 family glycosyltransferase